MAKNQTRSGLAAGDCCWWRDAVGEPPSTIGSFPYPALWWRRTHLCGFLGCRRHSPSQHSTGQTAMVSRGSEFPGGTCKGRPQPHPSAPSAMRPSALTRCPHDLQCLHGWYPPSRVVPGESHRRVGMSVLDVEPPRVDALPGQGSAPMMAAVCTLTEAWRARTYRAQTTAGERKRATT